MGGQRRSEYDPKRRRDRGGGRDMAPVAGIGRQDAMVTQRARPSIGPAKPKRAAT
jgi:hypothetical protein